MTHRRPIFCVPPAWADIAQATAMLLGAAVLTLAGVQVLAGWSPTHAVERAASLVGLVFPSVFAALTVASAASAVRLARDPGNRRWRQIGLQAASGVATLALTFTLLGISLGIGGLADRPLTPASVQEVIGELTGRFALAFATTVVGLPTAAGLRALILVLASREVRP
ncbi:hypothetical protein [Thalassobaculum sp.]|uniref:hypothetical protein n=1 Tax=Thalassobaculum sp. TaxID=2022740 RepID=UPI0032EE8055